MQRSVSNWLTSLVITHFCLNYQNNIFGVQFIYGMDGALQIYQEYGLVVLNFVYSMVWVAQRGFTSTRYNDLRDLIAKAFFKSHRSNQT